MKTIIGEHKGFFALCNDTARQISHCLKNNEEWNIVWGPETLYYDINKGPNAWEYFFKQTYPIPANKGIIVAGYTDLILEKDKSFRETMHTLYSKYFILNENVDKLLHQHIEFLNKHNTLGVHIRRTDKFTLGRYGTTQKEVPVDLEIIKQEIDNVIKDYEYIYLATDCEEACTYMKEIYGKKVIYNHNAFRSTGNKSVHVDCQHISGYKKGIDVLSDVILLSKCKHLIRSSSNVSITALYLNLELTHLNLNEKYLNHSEKELL